MSEFTNAICGGADILRVIKFVWILLDLVFWIVPMALIVMISVDFFKSVMAGKEDDMKKNLNLVIKRIIFCVALFFVMPIVEFVVGMFAVETETDWVGDDGKKVNWASCINIATTAENFDAYEIDWEDGNSSEADGTSSGDSNSSTSSDNNSSSALSDNGDEDKEESIKIDVSGYNFKSEKIKQLVANGQPIEVGSMEHFWVNGVRELDLRRIVYDKEIGKYKDATMACTLNSNGCKQYTISELANFEIKNITEVTDSTDIDVDSMNFKDSKIKELVKNKKPIEIKANEQFLINGSVVILINKKLTYDSELGVYVSGIARYTIDELATAEIKEVSLTDSFPN